ncbi:MAG: thiamine pyrophosphate-requiring protein [Desulfobacterales bacterium]|nr:thiamine pyrophosphate-requiring protein [Desulfobacterales bacterium]
MMKEDQEKSNGTDQRVRVEFETTAEAYLELLDLRGIEYFFANAGTDFASIIDAFAHRRSQGKEFPRPVTVPHETPLVSMAHGYYMVTGKPQVAMVHVNVGTANGLGGLIGASRARVPILFSAGRTPITESGQPACRSGYIHWGQESFDQAGMLREYVKWDYELRNPAQLETVVDRALLMAMAEPKGPVYLTLPREIISSPFGKGEFRSLHRFDLPTFYPDPEKIREAAGYLMKAQFPLIITSAVGRSPAAVQFLTDLVDAAGIGVVSINPEYMNFPMSHPGHLGFSPEKVLSRSDLVLVVDCDVPWYPNKTTPPAAARIVQIGIDPYYSDYPIRGFPSDLTLQGDPARVLFEITKSLTGPRGIKAETVASRNKVLKKIHEEVMKGYREQAERAAHDSPLEIAWVSHCVNRILGDDTIVVNEPDNAMKEQPNHRPGRYFGTSHAGYLGWGIGAALGVKLACPDKTVIATVGDGSYMFCVPSACHFVSAAQQLPILTIVYNNQCWNTVKRANLSLHPSGWAARTGHFPLCDLEPTVPYEKICEAFGGYGERVEHPDQMAPALDRALQAVKVEKRQALLNVICRHP